MIADCSQVALFSIVKVRLSGPVLDCQKHTVAEGESGVMGRGALPGICATLGNGNVHRAAGRDSVGGDRGQRNGTGGCQPLALFCWV